VPSARPDRPEHAHLDWAGVQRDHSGEREGQERDLVAEVGDGLADPELQEFAVAPKAGQVAERSEMAISDLE